MHSAKSIRKIINDYMWQRRMAKMQKDHEKEYGPIPDYSQAHEDYERESKGMSPEEKEELRRHLFGKRKY